MRPTFDLRAAALILLSLSTMACNRAGDPPNLSLEDTVAGPASASSSHMMALAGEASLSTAPAQPIASLPEEAGAVRSVRSHNYVNGFRQDILLAGNPLRALPNSLTVLARTSRQETLDEATPLYKPTESAIHAELSQQFPRIPMQVVERASSNAYGPYGFALGRDPHGIHCLYMWQWIDENRLPREAGVAGPVSVRIRLCQSNTTFDAMAALVDHLTIGRAAATRYALASNDQDGIVAGPTDIDDAKPRPRHHARHTAKTSGAGKEARREPTTSGSEPGPAIPTPTDTRPAVAAPLSMDLPAQAYLGPKQGSAPKPN